MLRKSFLLFAILILTPSFVLSETIDVMIKGVDDGVKTNRQQDYNEAVMNAKLQAIERAGVEIQSITQVVNFQTKFDMVESKAKAVLMPGFQIMDIGYQVDGTYQVVLSGKVQYAEKQKEVTCSGLDLTGVWISDYGEKNRVTSDGKHLKFDTFWGNPFGVKFKIDRCSLSGTMLKGASYSGGNPSDGIFKQCYKKQLEKHSGNYTIQIIGKVNETGDRLTFQFSEPTVDVYNNCAFSYIEKVVVYKRY